MELWDNILSSIEKKISYQNFDIWFKPTSLQRQDLEGKKLLVRVPNTHFKYWLAENYGEIIQSSLSELELDQYQVSFVVENHSGEKRLTQKRWAAGLKNPCPDASQCHLNTKYTFSRFVVGFCNQFAHGAAVAVSEQPAKAYNPLFVYGGVGLGKTHLMHAMGHCIKAQAPQTRLTYMSSEQFMNELINSIRYDKTTQFREKYRNIDVLLIDDIQFLAGKERTQEEFFHTFNALYDSQKQIVITSDCPPREIPTLQERLHSRFEWGLIADIQPPDVETKIAILREKAEFENVSLPDDVAYFIASNVKSNIRELEGSLVRLAAYASLTGEQITLALAQQVLRNVVENNTRVITVDRIQKVVADHYSLKVTELKARDNSRRVAEPRQIAMYLCRELMDSSLPQIGKEFGGKHHTTVLHSIRKIEAWRKNDPKLNNILKKLTDSV
ncbi:chromosomal replication initiator protein DnaA [Acidobacteria bacterium AH-259-D05]|nr:chromosomal replication initiator protein DnaA [Acidobacteria bacterium AH-259-D05]